ncbi:iron-containing alcohol dehydrogenase [Levilactobacillus angrenensis]|uniref:Iron-containing alcohol dehydrogenase n=1 Tax=Levilactobacillus angrenensis TaxID=2486020 RepID=A0ABW1U8T6_9LACO|nr:iron-containing alcohol dehydrogenase [Levilactobacillus angrenensis]
MNFQFNHQTRIISGAGELDNVGSLAKTLSATSALIVCDPFFKDSSVMNRIQKSLNTLEIKSQEYADVQPNPRDYDCENGVKVAQAHKVNLIIALGGGSAMDEGKAIGALMTNGGKCSDWDAKPLNKPMLPMICIPTTAGTGSEVTFCAVIDDTQRHFKMAFQDEVNLIPTIALLDPELTVTLPAKATAGPGMDVMTHAIEAYTCKVHNPISDALALQAIRLVYENLPKAFKNPKDINARENMLVASSIAGMAFINANVGSVHALSETIGALHDFPHGLVNALLLVPTIEYNLDSNWKRFSDIAQALGVTPLDSVEETAHAGVSVLKKLISSFDLPNLQELGGLHTNEFSDISKKAMQNDLTLDNSKTMTASAYKEIIEKAYSL